MLNHANVVTDLPENVLSFSMRERKWNGTSVEVSRWRGSGMVAHRFRHEGQTRLVTLLDEVAVPASRACAPNQPCPVGYNPRHMDFRPGRHGDVGATAPTPLRQGRSPDV
jgi:hypothetical protein